jgi:hypothetical protein
MSTKKLNTIKTTSNIYKSAIYPYYLLKFFGLFPTKLTKYPTKEAYSVKLYDKVYILIVLALHILLFYHSRPARKLSSFFIVKVWELNAYLGFLMIVFLIFYQYWKSEKIMDIFESIHEFDEKVSK